MPQWTVELDDGRTVELEHPTQPTEAEIRTALQGYKPAPEPTMIDTGPYGSRGMPYVPGSFNDPGISNDPENLRALLIGPATVGAALHKVWQPIEWAGTKLMNAAAAPGADPFSEGITHSEQEPGETIFPQFMPEEGEVGFVPSAQRAAAGFFTPGNVLAMPLIPEATLGKFMSPKAAELTSRGISGYFAGSMGAAIPEQLLRVAEAKPGPERTGALTELGITTALGGLALRHSTTARQYAGQNTETATVHGDVRSQPGEGEGQVPLPQSGGGVQPQTAGGIPETASATQGEASLEQRILALQRIRQQRGAWTLREQAQFEKLTSQLKEQQSKLSPEEQAMIDAERGNLDTPIDVVSEPGEGDEPFAAGGFMRANRKRGRIEVIAPEFKKWLTDDLAGLTPEEKAVAVRTRLAEERIHMEVDDAAAKTYWDNLTGLEKYFFERIYLGKGRQRLGLSDTQMGHEAIRYRIQQLSDMTPSELAETIGREKWTLKTIAILESAVRGIRETLRTKARSEQAATENTILDRVDNKIQFARGIITGESPNARRRIDELSKEEHDKVSALLREKISLRRQQDTAGPDADVSAMKAREEEIDNEIDSIFEGPSDEQSFPAARRRGMDDEESYLDRMLSRNQGRAMAEEKGQQILDQLEESGATPDTVIDEFFNISYPRLNDSLKSKVDQFLANSNGGVKPDNIFTWKDITKLSIESNTIDTLGGTDRGVIALMEEINRQMNDREAPSARRRGMTQKSEEAINTGKIKSAFELIKAGEEVPDFLKDEILRLKQNPETKQFVDYYSAQLENAGKEIPDWFSPRAKHGGEAVPSEERVGTGFTHEEVTPAKVDEMASAEFEKDRPLYDDLVADAQERFGPRFERGSLREAWMEQMSKLIDAPGSRLEKLVNQYRLRPKVIGPERAGQTRPMRIADPRSALNPVGKGEWNTRMRALAALWEHMHDLSEGGRADIKRSNVTPEELRWSVGADAYEQVPGTMEPERLGGFLTRDAGTDRTTKDIIAGGRSVQRRKALPESATRRLVALLAPDGKVHLVSTYRHGRQGPVVIDPAAFKDTHRPVNEVTSRYRPIYTMLLDEPVQNFHKVFKSLQEYNQKFGSEARNRAQQAGYGEFGVTPTSTEPEGSAGIAARPEYREGAGAFESSARITVPEGKAVYEWLGEEPSTEAASKAFTDLQDRARAETLTPKDRQVISFLRKAYDRVSEDHPDWTWGKIIDQTIYETIQAARYRATRTGFLSEVSGRHAAERPIPLGAEPAEVPEAQKTGSGAPVERRELEVQTRKERELRKDIFGGPLRASIPIEGAGKLEKVEPPPGKPEVTTRERYKYLESQRRLEATRERAAEDKKIQEKLFAPVTPEETAKFKAWQEKVTAKQGVDKATALAERYTYADRLKRLVDAGEAGSEEAEWMRRLIQNIDRRFPTERNTPVEGANDPFARRRPVLPPKGELIRGLLHIGSQYDEHMAARIARVGGPESKKAAKVFTHIIDRAKQLYGGLTPTLDPARMAAGGAQEFSGLRSALRSVPSAKLIKGNYWLSQFAKQWTNYAATSRTVPAIEGEMWNPKTLTTENFSVDPDAQPVVNPARLANAESGKLAFSATTKRNRKKAATGKFERHMAPFGYDVVQAGPPRATAAYQRSAWKKIIDGNYAANRGVRLWVVDPVTKKGIYTRPLNRGDVEGMFLNLRDAMIEPAPDMAKINKINQDIARKLPNVVTHIHHGGRWQEVVHANLFNYLENAAQRAAHIAAFREQFPNTAAGRTALAGMLDSVNKELEDVGHRDDLVALIKSLQGQPTDSYGRGSLGRIFGPTSAIGGAARIVNQTVGNLFAKAALTAQMGVQTPETVMGATPVFLGYKNWYRGMQKLRDSTFYEQMEQAGNVNRMMYDFTWDSHSPVRSAFRIAGNTISKVFAEQLLNELQEANAAATASVVTERIAGGKLSSWEKRQLPQTFKAMGFDEGDVTKMMAGDKDLLYQFESKAAAFLTGGNRAIAEGSRLGANRLLNSIFRFQMYPMMKMNQFRRVTVNLADAWQAEKTITKTTPSGSTTIKVPDWAQRRAATEQFARFMFGTTAQGAMVSAISALMFGGTSGLRVWANETADEPLKALADFGLGALGGPLYLAWRGAKAAGLSGVTEQAARTAFPYALTREIWDMLGENGKYRDQDWFHKIGRFMESRVPGARAIEQGLATFGLSQDNADLDTAIRAANRFKISEFGMDTTQRIGPDAPGGDFRAAMKKAVRALQDGNMEDYTNAIAEAIGARVGENPKQAWQHIAQSLDRMKMLRVNNKDMTYDQIELLKQHIGPEAVELLRGYDMMLEGVAKTKTFIPIVK